MNNISITLRKLPHSPGIYFFKNNRGQIIYIGKASDLKNRVQSYFRKQTVFYSPSKYKMLKEIEHVAFQKTDSEIEALLLEVHLIKKFQPPYNIVSRDDKSFLFVKITEEDFPKIITTRKITPAGKYFGPFTSASALKETLRILRKFFPFRTVCQLNQKKPCLAYQIGLCPGTCMGAVSKREYQKTIKQIIKFFEGKKTLVLKELKQQCKKYQKEDPPRALALKSKMDSLQQVLVNTKILSRVEKFAFDAKSLALELKLPKIPQRIEGYDVSNIRGTSATGAMVVFAQGSPDKNEYKKFKIKIEGKPNDIAMLKEILERRFGHKEWTLPDLMIIDGGRAQLNIAKEVLDNYRLKIPVISLAKRFEEVYTLTQDKPLVLGYHSPALHLIQRVRDEAHRFAHKYYHWLYRRKMGISEKI